MSRRLDDVLDAAEVLWCRRLTMPSVRAIAAVLCCAPSSVLRPFGAGHDLQASLVAREWLALDHGWFSAHPKARPAFFRAHTAALRCRDPVLLRLPGLVLASVAPPVAPKLAVPWFALGAFSA